MTVLKIIGKVLTTLLTLIILLGFGLLGWAILTSGDQDSAVIASFGMTLIAGGVLGFLPVWLVGLVVVVWSKL